jgi:hypothetical protein
MLLFVSCSDKEVEKGKQETLKTLISLENWNAWVQVRITNLQKNLTPYSEKLILSEIDSFQGDSNKLLSTLDKESKSQILEFYQVLYKATTDLQDRYDLKHNYLKQLQKDINISREKITIIFSEFCSSDDYKKKIETIKNEVQNKVSKNNYQVLQAAKNKSEEAEKNRAIEREKEKRERAEKYKSSDAYQKQLELLEAEKQKLKAAQKPLALKYQKQLEAIDVNCLSVKSFIIRIDRALLIKGYASTRIDNDSVEYKKILQLVDSKVKSLTSNKMKFTNTQKLKIKELESKIVDLGNSLLDQPQKSDAIKKVKAEINNLKESLK